MSNPFVNNSFGTESTNVEVHQLDDGSPPVGAASTGPANGSTPLDNSIGNSLAKANPTTTTTSWVQFEESGGGAGGEASAGQQSTTKQTTTTKADVHQPELELKSSSNGHHLSSISTNSTGVAEQQPSLPLASSSAAAVTRAPTATADSNNFATEFTIELSHSIEITHPQSAILKPHNQPSSSAASTTGGHLKVNNVSAAAAGPISPSSSSSLPKSPTPSLAATGTAPAPASASTAFSHFANGDVIVTLLPLNEGWDWVTPAKFKAHLVPEELMAQSLTLTVEDYVTTMSVLFSDYRFNFYIIFHKRVLGLWISLSILILLCLLFSGWTGVPLFIGGMTWLLLNALGIFAAIYIKQKLYRMLEEAIAQVNAVFCKHNVFLGLDDRGRYSCHKVELVFVYFDAKYCIKFLQDMLNNSEQQVNSGGGGRGAGSVRQLNNVTTYDSHQQAVITLSNTMQCIDTSDIIITGSAPRKLSQKEKYADKLLLRYSQRWIREYNRERMELTSKQQPPREGTATQAEGAGGDGGGTGNGTTMMMNNQQPHPSRATASSSSTATPTTCNIPIAARHCRGHFCFCQMIEEHLKYKPVTTCSMLSELFRS